MAKEKDIVEATQAEVNKKNKECILKILPALHESDSLYYFVAGLTSETNLETEVSCDQSIMCLRNMKEGLDELNLLEKEERVKLQELIDKSIDICLDRIKEIAKTKNK